MSTYTVPCHPWEGRKVQQQHGLFYDRGGGATFLWEGREVKVRDSKEGREKNKAWLLDLTRKKKEEEDACAIDQTVEEEEAGSTRHDGALGVMVARVLQVLRRFGEILIKQFFGELKDQRYCTFTQYHIGG